MRTIAEEIEQAEAVVAVQNYDGLQDIGTNLNARSHQQASNVELTHSAVWALGFCKHLYIEARSLDAVPFAQASLCWSRTLKSDELQQRALTACGLLLGDLGDVAGAIEYHVSALRLAGERGKPVEASRCWINIGSSFGAAGNYKLAASCYSRGVDVISSIGGPLHSRFAAQGNLALCHLRNGNSEAGLAEAHKALHELTQEIRDNDAHSVMLLHRNMVRLYIALNQMSDAEFHLAKVTEMARTISNPRADIACATAQAAYELANGMGDLALTRLSDALVSARKVPGVLSDTLICVAKAEEESGRPDKARLRIRELADHAFESAIEKTRKNIQLAHVFAVTDVDSVAVGGPRGDIRMPRLEVPAEWDTVARLAVTASLRVDDTGWHGVRVGALTKSLALECGYGAIDALEIGLAAQLHDIGMLSVPDSIAMRKGILIADERIIVERHIEAGSAMLTIDKHPRWQIAKEIATYHHARWDGHGAPKVIAGINIPMPARMCAVADAYDSLVTARPWRPAITMQEALCELRAHAGTQFDAGIVERFGNMVEREVTDLGIDPSLDPALNGFQAVIDSLSRDKGFV